MIAWFDANDKARTGPVGCVGHCMSGCDITTVSMRFPHRMLAAPSLHGVNIVTNKRDPSHQLLPRVKGEPCYALAEHDQSVPANVIPELRASLAKTDVAATVKVFDGTHHGFCFAERAVYNAKAAEQTWPISSTFGSAGWRCCQRRRVPFITTRTLPPAAPSTG